MFHPASSLAECGEVNQVHESFDGSYCIAQHKHILAGRSKRAFARPQRVKARGIPSWYVEGLNDARTTLADFFSALLIAWWFEVARRAILPGDRRLFGLFDETTQIHFGGTE